MKKRSKVFRIVFYILIIIFLVVMALIINPILRTEASIRRQLLRITPIGTSMEEVISIADDNARWTIDNIREDGGVSLLSGTRVPTRRAPGDPRFSVIGEQSVRIHLGTFQFIIRFDVTAFYAFDENGELIEILVRREFDVI